jgi:pilus assembly protein CpaE
MDATPGILLLTSDAETERLVSTAVSSESGLAMGPTCRSLQELANRLRQSPARIAVVDLGDAPEKSLALLDPVISRFGETRFVVLSHSPAQSLLMEAMHVGARHVVARESIRADLPPVLRRMAQNGAVSKTAGRGFIISILSASGGSGATLLATNLAYELHLLATGPTLLVDLDVFSGAIASYMNLNADYDLATVLIDETRIDGELIKSSSAMVDQRLYVLLSPGAALSRHAARPRMDHLPRLLAASKDVFDYTVIDAPRLALDESAQVASASSLVIVPFQLSVVGIRATKNMIHALVESGVPADHIMPIASRHRRRRVMIGLDEAARALGRPGMGFLTNDFKASLASVNLGQPLAVGAKRSKIRRDIERLAQHIHNAHSSGAHVGPVF